jgi:bla regulator protein blaR1
LPPKVQNRLAELQEKSPEGKYIVVEITDEAGQEKLDALKEKYGFGPDKMLEMEVMHNSRRGFAILRTGEATSMLSEATKQDGEIFLVVEEIAHPAEGMEKFFEFIKDNLKYPAEAKQRAVGGRVFIEFVVEKDGTLTNLKSLKGIGYGCDDEAIRVLSMSPPWKPAMQRKEPVRQRMVLPVAFSIAEKWRGEIRNGGR